MDPTISLEIQNGNSWIHPAIVEVFIAISSVNANCGLRQDGACTSNNNVQPSKRADLPPEPKMNLGDSVSPPPPPPPKVPRKRCCPYDFNSRICKTINDRVLCGYNKNVGRPEGLDNAVDLSDGCRLRGGRLECGYQEAPFTNPRRPPVWYNYDTVGEGKQQAVTDDDYLNNDVTVERLKKKVTKIVFGPGQRCVEIKDRIVCRDA